MTVTVTFNHDDPKALLHDMAAMCGHIVSAPPVSDVSYDTPKIAAEQSAPPAPAPKTTRGRPRKLAEGPGLNVVAAPAEEPKPLISTGEERVETAQVDTQATEQDELDEAVEQVDIEAKTLTYEDVRNAGAKYVTAFEMTAAQVDFPKMMTKAAGSSITNVGALPDDPAVFRRVIDMALAAVKAGKRYGV